jgi:hypothetical protein
VTGTCLGTASGATARPLKLRVRVLRDKSTVTFRAEYTRVGPISLFRMGPSPIRVVCGVAAVASDWATTSYIESNVTGTSLARSLHLVSAAAADRESVLK